MNIAADQLQAARQRLNEAQGILLVSHERPDGDAVCSILALGLALQARGQAVQMVLQDGVGSSYGYLEGSDQISRKYSGSPDVVVAVDSAARDRLGRAAGNLQVDINIDHHITNTQFGVINLVDDEAIATCSILAEYFPDLGLELSKPVAEALMVGMLTDTLGFRTSNMSPKALRLAADLMDLGADLPALYHHSLLQRSFEAMRYWGAGLSQLERDQGLVWATLTLEDRKRAGYPGNDDAELVNALSAIQDAEITVLFIEQNKNEVKVSWRSEGQHDVAQIASQFDGGGHRAAAGASVAGDLESAKMKVLNATREAMGLLVP